MKLIKHNNDKIFKPQKTRFTCGPASLASLAAMLGICVDETAIANATRTMAWPVGTEHAEILTWANNNLPVLEHGEGVYDGGVALANIKNPFSGNGHYVVMLGEDKTHICYYCPFVNEIVEISKERLIWTNSNGSLENWAINFAIIMGI